MTYKWQVRVKHQSEVAVRHQSPSWLDDLAPEKSESDESDSDNEDGREEPRLADGIVGDTPSDSPADFSGNASLEPSLCNPRESEA